MKYVYTYLVELNSELTIEYCYVEFMFIPLSFLDASTCSLLICLY